MSWFADFVLMNDPNVRVVVPGVLLLCGMSAAVGCFTYLRKRSLIGDAISHSVLPGICIAFILHGEKNTFYFLMGAMISGLISVIAIDYLTRTRYARNDTAIALMLSVFFGLGIVLLTYIQHQGNASQAGLDSFLFGKAASLSKEDLLVFSISSISILIVIVLFMRGLSLVSFDESFASSIGFPVKTLKAVLSVLTVWSVATGIQAVGVVLMAALLIAPALAARMWTNSILKMIILAAVLGMISGYSGTFISYALPQMPTGPWIVVMASVLAVFSLLLAPKRGLISQMRVQRNNERTMLKENILKIFYHLDEKIGHSQKDVLEEDLLNQRSFSNRNMRLGLRLLKHKGFLSSQFETWSLTESGRAEAKRVVRLHRLWELYLQEYLHLDPDHVHDDAEAMEHVITPEIERQLDELLGNPTVDPHKTIIPSRDE
ncbi:MAG: iron chelate uptake ABC transporter family permease subunit [Bacteroidia bacterium]